MDRFIYQGIILLQITRLGESACQAIFRVHHNTYAKGAYYYPTRDLNTCKKFCQGNVECTGFNWDGNGVGKPCWIHHSTKEFHHKRRANGLHLYILTERCRKVEAPHRRTSDVVHSKSKSSGKHCQGVYVKHTNRYATGASYYPTRSLQACKDFCTLDLHCTGFNWDGTGTSKPCWVHRSTGSFGKKKTANRLDLYILKDRCRTTDETYAKKCQTEWREFRNTYSKNGYYHAGPNTVQNCKADCRKDPTCVGVNVDLKPRTRKRCWFHNDPNHFRGFHKATGLVLVILVDRCKRCISVWNRRIKATLPNGNTRQGINAENQCKEQCLGKKGCLAVSIDKTVGVVPRCALHMSRADIQRIKPAGRGLIVDVLVNRCTHCLPIWSRTQNERAKGGVRHLQVPTVMECLHICVTDPECLGADFQTGNKESCVVHTKTSDFASLEPHSKYQHYVLLERCRRCLPVWMKWPNVRAEGGYRYPAADTLKECREACVLDHSCLGIDFDFIVPGSWVCFFHSNVNDLSKKRSQGSVDFYVLADRCRRCTSVWTTHRNKRVDPAIYHPEALTEQECKSVCLLDDRCLAINLMHGTRNCELIYNADAKNGKLRSVGNYDFFLLRERCLRCTPVWQIVQNSKARGGVPKPDVASIQDCLDACAEDISCNAANIDTNPDAVNFCWLVHKRHHDIQVQDAAHHSAAVLVQRCKHCTPLWLRRDHSIADGGFNYPTATSETQCRDACAEDDYCVGVHYDIRPGSDTMCWFHTNVNDFKKISKNIDFVLYELLTRCQRCLPIWQDIWHTHANGEMAYEAATSREDCLRVCLYDEDCIAIGYEGRRDARTVCFIHKDQALYNQKQYNKKSTYSVHYLVERCKYCMPIWYVHFERYLKKGVHHPGPVTEDDCADDCVKQSGCVGFNFDKRADLEKACWLHYDMGRFSHMLGAKNLILYKLKERCARCKSVWGKIKDTSTYGGRLYKPAATERECKGICADDRTCVGIYIDKRPGAKDFCWMLNDRRQLHKTKKDKHYDMYTLLERCKRCTARWNKQVGRRVEGAVHFVSDLTGRECKQACTEDDRCKGVQIDNRSSTKYPCWFIRDDTSVTHPVHDGNFNLYLMAARCKHCKTKWDHLPNTRAMDGVNYQAARNKAECMETCVEDMKCQAAAYDFNSGKTWRCWHYQGARAHKHTSASGFHLFVILERCSRCKSVWAGQTDTRGVFGSYYPLAVSEKECKDACTADIDCAAISVNMDPKSETYCTLYAAGDNLTPVSAKNFKYFLLRVRCADMKPLWEKREETRAVGGYSYPATTVSECKEACFEDDNCVGIDIDGRPNPEDLCWLHNNVQDIHGARHDDHFMLYVLQERWRRCTTTWNQFPKMDFAGGHRMVAAVQSDCKAACILDERCAGFYMNAALSECYYTTSVNTFSHLTHEDSSSAYLMTHRCRRCTTFWLRLMKMHAMNGYRVIGTARAEDCKEACSSDEKCLGVDFSYQDPFGKACYFHSNPKDFSDVRRMDRIVHYRIIARCKECIPVWSRLLDMRADGGNSYTQAASERDCKMACVQHDNCLAVYYKTNAQKSLRCWLVDTHYPLNHKKHDTGFTLYILRERCRTFTPIWQKVMNRQPKGGHGYTAHTPQQCRKLCVEDDTCVAISMTPQRGGHPMCLLHDNFAELENPTASQGSVIFKLVERCRHCTVVWKKYPNKHFDSHEFLNRDIKGEDECKSACAADDSCAGIDVSRQGLCFFHTKFSDVSQLTQSNDMDAFFMVERCRHCVPLWHKQLNKNAKDGYRYPGPATEGECKHACAINSTCKAVAFDRTEMYSPPCWFFTKLSEIIDKKDTVLYKLEERCKKCLPAWIRKMNMRANGGLFYPAATTENDCKIACAQDDGCFAVDVDTNPRSKARCWFHVSRQDLAKTIAAPGYRLYILSERCRRFTPIWDTKKDMKPAGGIHHATAKTEKDCKEACTADSTCVGIHIDSRNNGVHECNFHTNKQDFINVRSAARVISHAMVERCRRCRPVWHKTINQRASGGYHREASSTEECMESCVDDDACLGVGVNMDTTQGVNCWFHLNAKDFSKITTIHGRILYLLVERCRRCSPTWFKMSKVRMRGGVHYPIAVSEKECRQACVEDIRCVGVNVDSNPNTEQLCWLHYDKNDLSARTNAASFTFLQLLDRCKLCAAVWEKKNGMLAGGGVEYPAAVSESDCKEACADDYKCFGVDINLTPNATTLCHFHTEPGDFAKLLRSNNAISYKLVERCRSFTPVWEKIVNKRAQGGVYNPGASNRRECKQACAVDEKCLGVDIDTTAGAKQLCFFHNESKDFLNVQNAPNFLQLKLLERTVPCTPIWKMYTHKRVQTGGDLYLAATSLKACKQACAKDNRCIGVSVDTLPTAKEVCWIFSDRTKLAKRSHADKFMVFELLERCRRCRPLWQVKKNTRSQFGMLFPTATTEKDCKDACISYSDCLGVDFNTNPQAKDVCYFHTVRKSNMRTTPKQGFLHYQLAQRCRQCTPIWKKIINKFVGGGVYYQFAVSEKDCRESCAADETCQGVHVDTRPGSAKLCWFHTSMKGQVARYENGIVTYELIDRCIRCVPDWKKEHNKRAAGAVLYRAATLEFDCKKACAEDYSCLGVEINTKPGLREICWFHTNKNDFSKTRSANGFNLFILKDRCPGQKDPHHAPSVTNYPVSSGGAATPRAVALGKSHGSGSNTANYHGCSFNKMPNKTGPRSKLFHSTPNLKHCMKHCKDKSDCRGFTYHKGHFKYCYMYTRNFVHQLKNSNTNDVYIRGKC